VAKLARISTVESPPISLKISTKPWCQLAHREAVSVSFSAFSHSVIIAALQSAPDFFSVKET
jgi:hypothetical protein